MEHPLRPSRLNDRLANLVLPVAVDIVYPVRNTHPDNGRWIPLTLLVLEVSLPPVHAFLESLLPPWLCICAVLAAASYLGNLDRRRWMYALTAAFLSPILYKAFWPLRNCWLEDEAVTDMILTGVSLILAAATQYLISEHVGHPFAPHTRQWIVLQDLQIPSTPLVTQNEPAPPPLVVHLAKRPRWLIGVKPKELRKLLPKHPVLDPKDLCNYLDIQIEEKRMRTVPWRVLRKQKRKHSTPGRLLLDSAWQRREGFNEDYDVTPGGLVAAVPSLAEPHEQDVTAVELPSTPAWARIDRTPPPPLSAARLDEFVAPPGPGERVLKVQVMASWKPIGDWLGDPTVDADEKWKTVRETVGSWKETCIRLHTKRIARYSIGTSMDTTQIVLGPMHLSMHDVLDFIELALREQNKVRELEKNLERFGTEYNAALKEIALQLIRMSKDYPHNKLIATMARLAARIKRAADWRRKELEWFAAERFVGEMLDTEMVDAVDESAETAQAKWDFMAKILRLGQEARERVEEAASRGKSAPKRNKFVDDRHCERESRRRQPAQTSNSAGDPEVVVLSNKILQRRIGPWMDLFEQNPYGSTVIERRRQQAEKLLEITEETDARPPPAKSRRRVGRAAPNQSVTNMEQEDPSEGRKDNRWKRVFGDTNAREENSERIVRREKTKPLGGPWKGREDARKARALLEAGALTGFDRFVAMNQFHMLGTQPSASREALKMNGNLAAADEVVVKVPVATRASASDPVDQDAQKSVAQLKPAAVSSDENTGGVAAQEQLLKEAVVSAPKKQTLSINTSTVVVAEAPAPKTLSSWKPEQDMATVVFEDCCAFTPTVEDAADDEEEL